MTPVSTLIQQLITPPRMSNFVRQRMLLYYNGTGHCCAWLFMPLPKQNYYLAVGLLTKAYQNEVKITRFNSKHFA